MLLFDWIAMVVCMACMGVSSAISILCLKCDCFFCMACMGMSSAVSIFCLSGDGILHGMHGYVICGFDFVFEFQWFFAWHACACHLRFRFF